MNLNKTYWGKRFFIVAVLMMIGLLEMLAWRGHPGVVMVILI